MDRRQFTMIGFAAITRLLGQDSCGPLAPAAKKTAFTRSEIARRVKEITAAHLDVQPAKVTDKARFVDDLGADSLDMVELTMAFEEAFDIEISDEECARITTVADAVKGITDRLNAEKRLSGANSRLRKVEQAIPQWRAAV